VSKPTHNVTPVDFRCQITGLLSRGFSVWALRQVLQYRKSGKPIPPRTIVITFDDGFESVYTNAWPILRELDIPATVFVSTAYLDSMTPFPFDAWGNAWQRRVPAECYRPLSTAQCCEMAAEGLIELGAHTHTHRDFRDRPDEFREDLQISVDVVRERFGEPEPSSAFPFGAPHRGYASECLVDAARKTGVCCALTTECVPVDPQSDPFRWGRFNAFPWDTGATLAAKLGGWYGWAGRLKRRVLQAVK
jgi:peptidoglycan/xylan/chitin deacetylase (PgdA/CDA1 family)